MQDYRVQLDVYHGPLDLLLYLIRRDEVDIHDIPIHRITEQYLEYVRTLRSLDIALAGEFLVMAATLMEVKSKFITPREEGDEEAEAGDALGGGDDAGDPRYELVQQLLAYKRFKDAATALDRRREAFAARFPRRPAAFQEDNEEQGPPELDLEDVSVWDLVETFTTLMEQVGDTRGTHDVVDDDTPIGLHAEDILDRIHREGPMTLQAMFAGRRSVSEMIGLFLAVLELLRNRKVRALQEAIGGPIRLEPRPESEWARFGEEDEPDEPTALSYDPDDPDNFDWPDERQRERYTRRIERRKRGEKVEEDEEREEDIRELEENPNESMKHDTPRA